MSQEETVIPPKFACSKERPLCSLCSQQGTKCVYSPKVERTPLTRQNLTAAEDRIRKLESVFAELLPDVDLEAILASLPAEGSSPKAVGQRGPKKSIVKNKASNPKEKENLRDTASPEAEEVLPQQPDGFDWAEQNTLSGLSDGMAALSILPEGSGYLGSTSSVMPLRALLTGGLSVESPAHLLSPGGSAHRIPFPGSTALFAGLSEQGFIDAYFLYYHTAYPFLHEATFRAQHANQHPRPQGNTWPILLNTVLALGAWSIGDENSTMDDAFYHEVNRISHDTSVFEIGNLALVQALLLLSNYTQKRNKPNTGWNYLGLAVRMALSLGLHREFPKWNISPFQREMRRRVWWGVYIFDSGASITFGRPVLLPESTLIDVNHVLNIHEENLTPSTTILPTPLSTPTAYSSLALQSSFHLTTNKIYHGLISTPPSSPHTLLSLLHHLDEWESSLPPYFQLTNPDLYTHESFIFARYRLSWRALNLRIILFRPTVLRWATARWTSPPPPQSQSQSQPQSLPDQHTDTAEESRCRDLCLQAARDTIASISTYLTANMPSRLGSWYTLYFLFQAGLIPIIFLLTAPTSPAASDWLDDLRVTKDLLSLAAARNPLAGRCLEIVERLCGKGDGGGGEEVALGDVMDVQALFMGELGGDMVMGDGMEFLDWSGFGGQQQWEG